MRRGPFLAGVAAAVLAPACALAEAKKLVAGDAFPLVIGASPAGARVVLPTDRNGMPFVVLYAGSQKAGDEAERWLHALVDRLPSGTGVIVIADLSGVPRLFRGMAVGAIRKSASQPQQAEHLVVLTERTALAAEVPDGNGDQAVIIVVDGTAHIADIERRAYDDAAADALLKRLASPSSSRSSS